MTKTFTMDLAGRPLVAEVGRVAAQANGAVLLHYGETVVLSTATASEVPSGGPPANTPPNSSDCCCRRHGDGT